MGAERLCDSGLLLNGQFYVLQLVHLLACLFHIFTLRELGDVLFIRLVGVSLHGYGK